MPKEGIMNFRNGFRHKVKPLMIPWKEQKPSSTWGGHHRVRPPTASAELGQTITTKTSIYNIVLALSHL